MILRERYKEQRREKAKEFLALKKPMYDNIEMYDPDGQMLCTIGKKKARWYTHKKGLAVWRTPLLVKDGAGDDDGDDKNSTAVPPSIQLLFTPKNNKIKKEAPLVREEDSATTTGSNRVYNTSHKKNICVACGSSMGLMRHYVVPYSYRRLLPKKFKSHLSHDIVLLCMDCHICAEHAGLDLRQNEYERLYRKDPDSLQPVIPNFHNRRVKSCAQALLKHRPRLPAERVDEYERLIQKYECLDSSSNPLSNNTGDNPNDITDSVLQDLVESIETETPNSNYIPIQELVVNALQSDQDVATFIRSWRTLFVATLHPRYLPVGWNVDSPVENDS
ncbi:MAG: hypothetical protein SGILL_000117 [Bacillariaceae sp.]